MTTHDSRKRRRSTVVFEDQTLIEGLQKHAATLPMLVIGECAKGDTGCVIRDGRFFRP